MGASDHFRRDPFTRAFLHVLPSPGSESGVADRSTGSSDREGNIPLSPFRCYVSKTSNISRSSDSVQCRTISQPLLSSFFRVHGGRYKSAHPPALQRFCFHLFFSGEGGGRRRCSLPLRRSLSLDLGGLGLPCFAFRRMCTRAEGPSAIGRREEFLTMLSRKILCRSARAHNGGQTRSC